MNSPLDDALFLPLLWLDLAFAIAKHEVLYDWHCNVYLLLIRFDLGYTFTNHVWVAVDIEHMETIRIGCHGHFPPPHLL